MSAQGRKICPQPLLLLAAMMLLSAFAETTEAAGGEFDDDFDGVYAGDLALDRRADDSATVDTSAASAELAGEAALGGLRRRLELDQALAEAVRAGRSAVLELRRQAVELRQLRAENAELRSVATAAASAAEAAASLTEAAEVAEAEEAAAEAAAQPSKRAAAVAPPTPAAEDAARDRDLRRLAGLLARHDSEEAEADGGSACFPAGTPLSNCAQVRRRFGLAMDAEAAALCDSHRLCSACAGHYGIAASACDRAFVSVAAGLCLREADPVACGRQADALLAAVQAAHAPADPVAADIIGCSRPCAARLLATVRGN